jgi:hypothetical protein
MLQYNCGGESHTVGQEFFFLLLLFRIWITVKMQFYTADTFFAAVQQVTENFEVLAFYFVFHVQNTIFSLFGPTRN